MYYPNYQNVLKQICWEHDYLLQLYRRHSSTSFEACIRFKGNIDNHTCTYSEFCDMFVQEFEKLSSTNWIVRYTFPSHNKYHYQKVYKCQHNNFNKTRTRYGKGENCNARITVAFKKVNDSNVHLDELLEKGYNGFINIDFRHCHYISRGEDAENLKALCSNPESPEESWPPVEMTKVCRLCLTKLARGSKYFNINAVESFTGFMPYRDQLTTCIPEMALDLIPNPVICNGCRTALKSSYDFKTRCLLVEKKIREFVESHPPQTVVFNLDQIDTTTLPKPSKPAEPVEEEVKKPASLLSDLLTVKKEVILSNKEIEVIPSTQAASKDDDSDGAKSGADGYSCNHCQQKFPNISDLHQHKMVEHEEDYLCNFCNKPFKSLQSLRKHNNICQKSRNPSMQHPVLTKRPHLPMKAKNHLKKWLFRHTEHPYPTDVEKQQLMKETNLSLLQVENWFINARRRILADLTKLKNLRGRHIGRKRNRCHLDLDYEDLFEMEPEKLLDEELDHAPFIASLEEAVFDGEPSKKPEKDPLDLEETDTPSVKMEIEVEER